jgi:HK97 family phage major capsid protein/HK97 family phage prohead protease
MEILDHSDGSVRDVRINSGSPLLWGHNHDEMIGVIEKFWLEDRKSHVTVRFSKNKQAEEVFQDVLDKIVTKVSIGYRILDVKLVSETEGQPDVYRVNEWEPYEVSFVSVPADITVGIERNPNQEDDNMFKRAKNQFQAARRRDPGLDAPIAGGPSSAPPSSAPTAGGFGVPTVSDPSVDLLATERARYAGINDICKRFNRPDLAERAIASGLSLDQTRQLLLESLQTQSQAPVATATTRSLSQADAGMSTQETQSYSLVRGILALQNKQRSFETEVSDSLAKKFGKPARGIYVPLEIQSEGMRAVLQNLPGYNERLNSKTLGTQPDFGGALVDKTYRPELMVEFLRNLTVLGKLGATYLTDLVGDQEIPRQTGSSGTNWVTEDVAGTDTTPIFSTFTMTPKTVTGVCSLTRRLMMQGTPQVEALIRMDMLKQTALAIDLAALDGTGLAGQPTGILRAAGVGTVTLAAIVGANTMTYAEAKKFETALITANSYQMGTPKWLITPGLSENMAVTPRFSTTDSIVICDGPQLHGYDKVVSNMMPNAATAKGAVLGIWTELLIAMWGVLDVVVDSATKIATGGVVLRTFQDVDVNNRHPQSFVKGV